MTSPITRAANAIGDTLNQKTTQETLEAAARAAIVAIREPTLAMIDAGMKQCDYSGNFALDVWHAMHDKMMEE
jgi:hypothetical protein